MQTIANRLLRATGVVYSVQAQQRKLRLDKGYEGVEKVLERTLAAGAYNDYGFSGTVNSPILFQLKKEGYLRAELQVLNRVGDVLVESYTPDANAPISLPFTPQEDGDYILRVTVSEQVGEYKIVLTSE
jgi:hypothetical protein